MPVGVTMMKSTDPYYCPAFRRQGEAGIFSIQVLNLESNATLDVDVEHKNDADTIWSIATSFPQWTTIDTKHVELTGLKQQVRYKYTVGGPDAASFVHAFAFAPTWRP